jgi:DNA-nicking Smr family endonuclease
MGKKEKAGFNTPFAALKADKRKAEKPKAETPKAESRGPIAQSRAPKADGRAPTPDRRQPPPESRPDAGGLSQDEADEFLRAMSGAAQLAKPAKRIEPEKRKESAQPDDDALALAELQALVEGDTPFHVVESEEFYSGSAPGVSHELLERLREGAFSFRRHVDLHGFTREDGKAALTDFIAAARRDGERCVLVVTGRGRSSPGGISVLREALPRWLGRFPLRSHVLAYCTARSVDGGPGAFYVLLRRLGSRPFGTS